MDPLDLKEFSKHDTEEILYRDQTLKTILERFTNIELKMHQCSITTRIFDFFRNDILTESKLKDLNIVKINSNINISALTLCRIIKSVPKNKDVTVEAFKYRFDKELTYIVYEILQLGKYLYSAVESSWDLPHKLSSDTNAANKVSNCTKKIDELLLLINNAIVKADSTVVSTFIDPEIIDLLVS